MDDDADGIFDPVVNVQTADGSITVNSTTANYRGSDNMRVHSTKLGRMIMNKIVYGIGLLLTGICGMSGIGIISELQASAFPDFKLFQKIFEANLILPFGLF